MDNETSEKRPAAGPSAAPIDEPLEATRGNALPPDEDAEAFAQEAANAAAMAALEGSLPDHGADEQAPEASLREPTGDEQALEASLPEPTADEQALEQAGMTARPAAPESLDEVDPAQIGEAAEEKENSFDKLQAKATKLTAEQVRHVLHALLFVAEKPLTIEQLKQATGLESRRLTKALEKLGGELREGVSGVVLSEISGGYQLRTSPDAADFVRRFLQVKPRRLTRAALETLAILAYRQPVTRPEVEDIRGVDCGAVMKALLDWKLIKILGRKDEVGRPILYGTTSEFLEFFQLRDLASLPTLREFQELNEESRSIVEEEHGPEPVAAIQGTLAELADPAFLQAEQERVTQSEAALAQLEQAMADTEEKAGALASAIAPPPRAGPGETTPQEEG